MSYKKLGILGGVGPLASVYFTDLLVSGTVADCDQAHIPFFLYNDVYIPDRSAFLLGKSDNSPLPALIDGVKQLEGLGCDLIVVTCNTAHYFYDEIAAAVSVPVLNIIENALNSAKEQHPNLEKIGILATDGTVEGKVYKNVAEKMGIKYTSPSAKTQEEIMSLIYDVKIGKEIDPNTILRAAAELEADGCDAVILGCTELSVVSRQNRFTEKDSHLIDAMTALAKSCVLLCGKEWKETHQVCTVL